MAGSAMMGGVLLAAGLSVSASRRARRTLAGVRAPGATAA
jgi:hypothetical protein